jgi:hypothetical protein
MMQTPVAPTAPAIGVPTAPNQAPAAPGPALFSQSPAPAPAPAAKQEQPKSQFSPLLIIATVIIVVLVGALIYLMLRPR